MRPRFLAASAVMTLLGITAAAPHAIAQQVASKDPRAVKAGTYKVEPYHTQVGFSVSHFGFTDFSGFFSGISGSLVLDPSQPSASKLEVSVPVQSVLTTAPLLDGLLKGDKWFDTAKFPTATFTSTEVKLTGTETATIVGDFTLHGVTKRVTLQAHLVGSGVNPLDKLFTVGFKAIGTIERSEFGVKQDLPLIGDDVRLTIDGAFELQQ